MLGTLAGAALAPLLVAMLVGTIRQVTALLLVFVWGGYSLFRANYAAFTVCITGYVVLLLYLAGAPATGDGDVPGARYHSSAARSRW